MTAREQLVNRIASMLCDVRRLHQSPEQDARCVLDIALPQITTVEQVRALAPDTLLLDERGTIWQPGSHLDFLYSPHEGDQYTDEVLVSAGPLTVVWSPS